MKKVFIVLFFFLAGFLFSFSIMAQSQDSINSIMMSWLPYLSQKRIVKEVDYVEFILPYVKSDLEKESFLLGTISDYMGHNQTFEKDGDDFYYQMVDIYSQQDNYLAILVDSLFRGQYPDIYITNNGASKGIKLYSDPLSKVIDSYYNYQDSRSRTEKGDIIYTGILKKDILRTNEQKLSYLAGVFLRSPIMQNEQTYFMMISNSVSKLKFCEQLLNELGCQNVVYSMTTGLIPVPHTITFNSSELVDEVIQKIQEIERIYQKETSSDL